MGSVVVTTEDPSKEERPFVDSAIGRRRNAAKKKGGEAYEERRKAIVETAAEIFREKGFVGTSIIEIAAAIGSDQSSFYYYFSSKRELFLEVVRDAAEANVLRAEAIRDGEGSPTEKLRTLICDLLSSYAEHHPYLFVYIQENLNHVHGENKPWDRYTKRLNKRFDDAVTSIIQAGFDDGSLSSTVPARVLAYGVIGTANWTHRWFDVKGELSAQQVGAAYADAWLAGLQASPPRKTSTRRQH